MLIELLYRFCQIIQPEVGRLVAGKDYSAVIQSEEEVADQVGAKATIEEEV